MLGVKSDKFWASLMVFEKKKAQFVTKIVTEKQEKNKKMIGKVLVTFTFGKKNQFLSSLRVSAE